MKYQRMDGINLLRIKKGSVLTARLSLPFAKFPGDAVPVTEHEMQPGADHPADQRVGDPTTGQLILQAVGKTGLAAEIRKLVPVNPLGERSLNLFVHKQRVFLIRRVPRDPAEACNPKFDSRTCVDAAVPCRHPHF